MGVAVCQVCGQGIGAGTSTGCPVCETPHHDECWRWAGRCSTFGCTGRPAGGSDRLEAVRLEACGPVLTGPAALAANHRSHELDVQTLAKLLRHADVAVRRAVAKELAARELAARSVPDALLSALRDPDAEVRDGAIEAIAHFPHVALEDVETVLGALTETGFGYAHGDIVQHLGPLAARLTPELIEALEGPEVNVPNDAIESLAAIGPKAAAAIPAVVRVTHHRNVNVRGNVAKTLAALGAPVEVQLEVARELLEDGEENVRWATFKAMAWLGLRALPLKKLAVREIERGLDAAKEGAPKKQYYFELSFAIKMLGRLGHHAMDCRDLIDRIGKALPDVLESDARWALEQIERASAAAHVG